ncbi:hypothetical protein niasHT_010786 [Heterodera trifolii]|uniref:MGAT4 conserved region domain-containing protein n=1 Tax=Heterodera trifolii TaxID=157864 RepID=A0ABD2KVI9_9BILA
MPLSLLTFLVFYSFSGENEALSNGQNELTAAAAKKPLRLGNVWFDRLNSAEGNESSFGGEMAPAFTRRIDPTALFDFLPHLNKGAVSDLNARVLLRAHRLVRSPPELVLVIPSMRRREHNYLVDTLRNLFANMRENEKHLVQIVIVLSENPWERHLEEIYGQTVEEIERNFGTEVRRGLIEVITPPSEWFPPNFDRIPSTLGDPPDRMHWRTKQSLDYAYAMFHTRKERPEARFYVQLEDDIITVPGFLSELHRFANAHPDFFVCEFSNLGFIGRLFHNGDDLLHLAYFVLLLYKWQPVDWILTKFISSKYCSLDDSEKQCIKKNILNVVVFRRNPPLFQHIGRHSSLPGKKQNLSETRFNRNKAIAPLGNENPPLDEVQAERATTEQWHAFYEKNAPIILNGTELRQNDADETDDGLTLVEFGYAQNPMAELRGFRLFFVVQFSANLSSVPLPNSLLRVRFLHSFSSLLNSSFSPSNFSSFSSDAFSLFSSFPSPNSPPLHDYFLLVAKPSLKNVRSIRISLSGGDWRKAIEHFTMTAIQIVT